MNLRRHRPPSPPDARDRIAAEVQGLPPLADHELSEAILRGEIQVSGELFEWAIARHHFHEANH